MQPNHQSLCHLTHMQYMFRYLSSDMSFSTHVSGIGCNFSRFGCEDFYYKNTIKGCEIPLKQILPMRWNRNTDTCMGLCVSVCVCVWCMCLQTALQEYKGSQCLRARPVGDLCLPFPTEPSCSRGVNIAPGCFVRGRRSHALLVNL